MVYFPVDGQLSVEFCQANNLLRIKDANGKNIGGYLNPQKRNIRAERLRGEISDGLVLPIEVLSPYCDINKLKDGDQITTLGGHEICKKYIPVGQTQRTRDGNYPKANGKNRHKKPQKITVHYPFFAEHVETEQLAYNEAAFYEGDTIYLTRKLHGTSMRVGNQIEVTTNNPYKIMKKLGKKPKISKRYNVISGSRRVVLQSFNGGFYGSNAFRKKYQDLLKDRVPKGMTIYGEIVGWIDETTPIMPSCSNAKVKDEEFSKLYGDTTTFTYGCEPGENELYVYRITMCNEDGVVVDLPTENVMRWCEILGLNYVPLLEKFLYTTWEDLNERCEKYLDIPEPLANGAHVVEGVVVRIDNRQKFKAYKTKSRYFKILEGIIKDEADAPDIEEAQEIMEEVTEDVQ